MWLTRWNDCFIKGTSEASEAKRKQGMEGWCLGGKLGQWHTMVQNIEVYLENTYIVYINAVCGISAKNCVIFSRKLFLFEYVRTDC